MKATNLELKNIKYKYPSSHKYALNGLSIKVSNGEKLAILGKNGMGKSTLFFVANGVIHPDQGQVFLNGKEIGHKNSDLNILRKNVGLVFQDPETQFIAPSVAEEISFGPLNLGYSQEEVKGIVERTLESLNIKELKEKSLYSLSGGEKKIVSIASVLCLEPELIFFDEPTAGLDYVNTLGLLKVLDQLHKKEIGLVISTHDIDFAWEWSNRVVIIKDGQVIGDGLTNEVLTDKDLMAEADLRRPYIVEFYDLLNRSEEIVSYPKNIEELKKFIKK